MSTIPVAVQLYTLRELIARDFLGTCRSVANMGYKGVELIDTRSLLGAADLKRELASMGLGIAGVHVGIEPLESQLESVMDYYSQAGVTRVVCPYIPENRRTNAADWKRLGAVLSTIGGKLRNRGFAFCYHNHDFEMKKFDGITGLDILFSSCQTGNMSSELDCFWVQFADEDPAAYIRKYSGRIPLLHCKDMTPGSERKFAPVGAGILDWKTIFVAAAESGVEWYIVEQDNCYDTPPLEAIRMSLENLKKMGIV